jgi:pyruvate dehydrogenase E2 component (dihydrolipoamide acetyltransferase)
MSEFRMPSLGADMEAGTLFQWLKQPGDVVKRGDVVAVVETQKGAIDIEIFQEGVIESLLVEPGVSIPVGTPLATIHNIAEPVTHATSRLPLASASSAPEHAMTEAGAPPQPSTPSDRLRVSPAARRLAAERHVPLAGITGTGPDGAILLDDVKRAGEKQVAPVAGPEVATKRVGLDMAAMRKAIAAAMARSKREIPHYYLGHTIDLAATVDWLSATNAQREPPQRLLLGALFLKSVALALEEYPEFNGFFTDGAFQPGDGIHVGTAIAIRGGGLVAPALRDANAKTLDEVMPALRDLVARARAGRLRSSELFEATITVSSLGERGVDSLLGVIYPPQVAIIGFGTPSARPQAVEGRFETRPVVIISLAADHRVSDGHRGALLLLEIERLLQHPEAL